MANFTSIHQVVTAAVGAVLISTACIAAAVGPATTAGAIPATAYASATLPVSDQALPA